MSTSCINCLALKKEIYALKQLLLLSESDKDISVCANCGFEGTNLLRCSRCKLVHYCDKTCQKNHWKKHKKYCIPVGYNTTNK